MLGLGVVAAARLEMVEDITALLPAGEGERASVVSLAREWGLMKKVVVVIGPGEPGAEGLADAADAVARRVRELDGVAEVISGMDMEQARRAAQLMMERGPRLYRPRGARLDGAAVDRRLAELKGRLVAPEALVMQEYLLADPLGMSRDALRGLEAAGAGVGATVERGRLVSADGRYALLLATVDFDPMDVGRSATFVEELARRIDAGMAEAGAGDLDAIALGGVHYAAASSAAIIGDVRLAFVLTALGVVLVFLLFFRRPVILPAALLPGAAGLAVATVVMWLAGVRLHALTIGFAATITGISVDYAIHLLHRVAAGEGGSGRERMERAVAAVARPLILGCATTVIAFGLVATSAFPGMRQLAVFSAMSLPVSLGATLLLLPSFHNLFLGAGPRRASLGERLANAVVALGATDRGRAGRAVIAVVFAVVAVLAALAASSVTRSGDPRDLGYTDPELSARETRIREIFGGLVDQTHLVASGGTMEEALEANDRLYEALLEGGVDAGKVLSVSPFLPSGATQERSMAAARRVWEDPGIARRFRDAGFSDGYFEDMSRRAGPPPIGAADYAETGLGRMVEEAVTRRDGAWHVLTRVSGASAAEVEALVPIAERIPGCLVASERLEAEAMLETMVAEVARMLGVWLAVTLVLLAVVERDPLFGAVAAVPAVMGVLCAAGIFWLLGRPLTPVASAGLTLVMGLGIDYGIFMRDTGRDSAAAVLASAFTTLAAFGVLACAHTRAMADIGLIILTGVTVSVLTALVLVPAIGRRRSGSEVP
jgi:predicted exporter